MNMQAQKIRKPPGFSTTSATPLLFKTTKNRPPYSTALCRRYICWIATNCNQRIEEIKKDVPNRLIERNLMINEAKTEEYIVKKEGGRSGKDANITIPC